MNVQYIVMAVVCIGLILVAWMIFAPSSFPGAEASYYANVKVRIGKELVQTGCWVDIEEDDLTFEKKLIPISLGGWGFSVISEHKGTLKIESFQDGVLVDRTALSWEIGRFEVDKPYTGTVKLGLPGSGQYTIKATIYPEGEQAKEDSITVEVPLN